MGTGPVEDDYANAKPTGIGRIMRIVGRKAWRARLVAYILTYGEVGGQYFQRSDAVDAEQTAMSSVVVRRKERKREK